MGRLDGKVVLITGAGGGQGRSHAAVFAREGADVIALDVGHNIENVEYDLATTEDLAETVRLVEKQGRRGLAVQANVQSQAELNAAVESGLNRFGHIDVAVINHGVLSLGKFWELSEDKWSTLVDINLSGVWRAAKAVAPHMIERLTGSIIVASSTNGIQPSANYSHYCAAKAGVIQLARAMALELGRYGIRCNTVLPGAVDTRIVNWRGALDYFAGPDNGIEEMAERLHYSTVLRGQAFVPVEQISNAMLFYASDDSLNVTGTVLPVESGSMLLPGHNFDPVKY